MSKRDRSGRSKKKAKSKISMLSYASDDSLFDAEDEAFGESLKSVDNGGHPKSSNSTDNAEDATFDAFSPSPQPLPKNEAVAQAALNDAPIGVKLKDFDTNSRVGVCVSFDWDGLSYAGKVTKKTDSGSYLVAFKDKNLPFKADRMFNLKDLDALELPPPPKLSGMLKDFETKDRVGVRVNVTWSGRKYYAKVTKKSYSGSYEAAFEEINLPFRADRLFNLQELATDQVPPPKTVEFFSAKVPTNWNDNNKYGSSKPLDSDDDESPKSPPTKKKRTFRNNSNGNNRYRERAKPRGAKKIK